MIGKLIKDYRMNNVKDNPYGKYNGNELDYILEVLDSENMDRKSNPYVNRFEEKFSEVFKSKYSIAHNSGTSTLHSCLVALGVEPGDEVISPAHTVIMNSFVTLYMGATPVYVDIDPDTFNMCPKDLDRKITSKTKAIQVVHMHGNPSDMIEIMKIAKNNNAEIIPIDSEHSALFQLIGNEPKENIRRLYITASGGPFFNKKRKDLKNVQPKDALKHPTWNMGEKISIDSATMMNKAIEIIEASIMFDINHKMITPVVNLDSHIHGIAEFVDGSYSISGSFNDMKIPISYSLNYPLRQNKRNYQFKIDKKIELIPIKESAYEAISIARKAMEIGGTMPTIMNAANSVAVRQFLKKEIAFLDIYKVIKKTMKNSFPEYNSSLKEILKINKTASEDAFNICNRL